MLTYLHPAKNNMDGPSNYHNYENEFKFKGITKFLWIFKIFLNLKTNIILNFFI